MKKLILILTVASVAFASCEKEDPIDVSKTKYLMDGYWMLKGSTINSNIDDPASMDIDQYASLDGCLKDNIYAFRSSSKFVLGEGNLKCDVNNPDSTEMYWKFTAVDNSYLIVYKDQADVDNTIYWSGDVTYKTIDTFILTYTKVDDDGVASRIKDMYVKQ